MSDTVNDGLPLEFMYEGKIYSKEIDGCYHFFKADIERVKANTLGSISIGAAKHIFNTTKYIGSIIVLSDNVNIKVQ